MTTRIQDSRLLELYETRFCQALPATIHLRGHRVARSLLAAQSLGDIIWPIAELSSGQYAVAIGGKWVIAFAWNAAKGAKDLALQRS